MLFIAFLILSIMFLLGNQSRFIRLGYILISFAIVIVHLFFSLEFSSRPNIDYFVSDEMIYALGGMALDKLAISDRWLWIVLNDIAQYPSSSPWVAQKFINILFLPLYAWVLYRISGRTKQVLWIFIFFPFLIYLFQVNLRDMTAMTLLMAACYFTLTNDLRMSYRIIISVSIVFILALLRPFLVPVTLFSIMLAILVGQLQRHGSHGRLPLRRLGFLLMFLAVSLFLTDGHVFLERYLSRIGFLMASGITTLDGEVVEFSLSYAFTAIARFIATPLPTSLITQIGTHGSSEYGYVHDILRLISQTSLYIMSVLFAYVVIFKRRAISSVLKSPALLAFVIAILILTAIYGIYFGGGGHSRTKIGLYHLVFIPVIMVYYKRPPNLRYVRYGA